MDTQQQKTRTPDGITFSSERQRIDFPRVQTWLAATYWSPGISLADVREAAAGSSMVVGAFDPAGRQAGYLRVVSDRHRFAYLCDVYVDESCRGRGIARAMVRYAMEHPDMTKISRWLLATADAHGVYQAVGFEPIRQPWRWMTLLRQAAGRVDAAAPDAVTTPPVPILQIDAFVDRPFSGNPAAVCLLEGPRSASWMAAVASQLNLSETAFVEPHAEGFGLRWFTPAAEVDLCGHATLASAAALWETGRLTKGRPARFLARSGWLTCRQVDDMIEMDFPAKAVEPCPPPAGLLEALGVDAPLFVGSNRMDYLVELPDEAAVRALRPDMGRLREVQARGVIATAKANPADAPAAPSTPDHPDFVSRFFAPRVGVDEDAVTGSAHCALGPWWMDRLGRSSLRGFQASRRGGTVLVRTEGDRVFLAGRARIVWTGQLAL